MALPTVPAVPGFPDGFAVPAVPSNMPAVPAYPFTPEAETVPVSAPDGSGPTEQAEPQPEQPPAELQPEPPTGAAPAEPGAPPPAGEPAKSEPAGTDPAAGTPAEPAPEAGLEPAPPQQTPPTEQPAQPDEPAQPAPAAGTEEKPVEQPLASSISQEQPTEQPPALTGVAPTDPPLTESKPAPQVPTQTQAPSQTQALASEIPVTASQKVENSQAPLPSPTAPSSFETSTIPATTSDSSSPLPTPTGSTEALPGPADDEDSSTPVAKVVGGVVGGVLGLLILLGLLIFFLRRRKRKNRYSLSHVDSGATADSAAGPLARSHSRSLSTTARAFAQSLSRTGSAARPAAETGFTKLGGHRVSHSAMTTSFLDEKTVPYDDSQLAHTAFSDQPHPASPSRFAAYSPRAAPIGIATSQPSPAHRFGSADVTSADMSDLQLGPGQNPFETSTENVLAQPSPGSGLQNPFVGAGSPQTSLLHSFVSGGGADSPNMSSLRLSQKDTPTLRPAGGIPALGQTFRNSSRGSRFTEDLS